MILIEIEIIVMAKEVIIRTHRDGYAINQVGKTMTIGQLKYLLDEYDDDAKVYISHDGGYMYSRICENDFVER